MTASSPELTPPATLGARAELPESARAVLDHLIDYAGLFPPAGLPMGEAVRQFASYQRGPDAWALGRFVVAASRLGEFEQALRQLPEGEALGARWPLSVLFGADPRADLDTTCRFRERHIHAGPEVQAIEARVASVAEVDAVRGGTPPDLELFLEVPLGAQLGKLIDAVRRAEARAKIRTGGVTAPDFPSPGDLLAFLQAACGARVPFKATAGLHHPVRGEAPLTYEPGSACATMPGYLNLALAATLLWQGGPAAEALTVLQTEGRSDLHLDTERVEWARVRVPTAHIARARREFFLSIGSCSFVEPLGEIRAL